MGCCVFKSIQPTTQEVVPGIAKFMLVFILTIISVFCIVSALVFLSGG
jgi:hypothetical protein